MSLVKYRKFIQEEASKFFDSHEHLYAGNPVGRPVILDLSMRKNSDGTLANEIVEENLQLVSAHADKTAILIVDRKSFNPNQSYAANIIYVVDPGGYPFNPSIIEKEKDKMTTVLRHASSIAEALIHIKETVSKVSERFFEQVEREIVNIRDHHVIRDERRHLSGLKRSFIDELYNENWTYMSTKEVRIVGDIMFAAEGLKYAKAAVAWTMNESNGKQLFDMRIVGQGKYPFFPMASVLQSVQTLTAAGYVLHKPDVTRNLGKDILTYAKDRNNQYRISEVPDTKDDVLIVPYEFWKQLNVRNAIAYIIPEDGDIERTVAEVVTNAPENMMRVVKTQYDAIIHIKSIEGLEIDPTNFDMNQMVRVQKAKKVHVFLPIIDEAY